MILEPSSSAGSAVLPASWREGPHFIESHAHIRQSDCNALCIQAAQVIVSLSAHEASVTALHWIQGSSSSSDSAGDTNGSSRALLATGSADGSIAVWAVQNCAHQRVQLHRVATLVSEPSAAADVHSRSTSERTGPITGLAGASSSDRLEADCVLASVGSDGCICVFNGKYLQTGGVEWSQRQRVEVPNRIIQHCVAVSHLPGHPEWCAQVH